MTIKEYIDQQFEKAEYGYYGSYEDAFFDCEILVWEAVGDYQGDYFVLAKSPDGQYGYAVIGYGSCSGCDALQDCMEDKEELINLLENIRDNTVWKSSAKELDDYLVNERDTELDNVYLGEDDTEVMSKIFEALRNE